MNRRNMFNRNSVNTWRRSVGVMTFGLMLSSVLLCGSSAQASSAHYRAADTSFSLIKSDDAWLPELRSAEPPRPVIVFEQGVSGQNVSAQNEKGKLRSRSDVVREVKQRYNAEVLKISLNQNRTAYKVRILMPNGRVREISVSARR